MHTISLGLVIIAIAILGFVSNRLNWYYLNYRITHFLYYIGAFVHETSHAILCLFTGAPIQEFMVFAEQPQIVHLKSRIPILGELLIAVAPIVGGLAFLFLVNRYLLGNYISYSHIPVWSGWQSIFRIPLQILAQLNPLHWQSWVMIFLSFNIGAMIGPSPKDLANVWPILVVLFLVHSNFLIGVGLIAVSLILVNIILQLLAVGLIQMVKLIRAD